MAEQLSKSNFPFLGGSYESRSKTFDCSRTVNLYVEMNDTGAGKGGEPGVMFSRAGLRQVQTLGLGPIRASYTVSNSQRSLIVSGNEVYALTAASGIPVLISGNLTTSAGFVSITDNGSHALLVDGVNGYFIDLSTNVLTTIVDPHFYNGAVTCTYSNGYFICDEGPQSSNFFISDVDGITFPALNEFSVDSSPDVLKAVIANNQQLYLLGSKTIEVWAADPGAASVSGAFSPISGRAINVGCTAPGTVVRLATTFLFLGANDQGDGVIYSMENESPTRVSTHAIEYRLQQLGDLSTATAMGWQEDGHYFYAINLPGANTTYVYDFTAKVWSERQTLVDGVMGRWLAQTHCFLNGDHIVGDYRNGNTYILDQSYYFDGTYPIRKMKQTAHSTNGMAWTFYKTLQVDIQPGVGSLTVDPRVVLRTSRDGGFTFGNPIYASMGKVGEYRWRARWQRLGRGRDVVFQVFCDDACPVVFLSAYLETEIGTA